MLHVSGKACPFDVSNVYNETMARGSLDEFLQRLKDRPVPMFFEHDHCVGLWKKLEARNDGLYVKGVITDPRTEAFIRNIGGSGELSITFNEQDHPNSEGLYLTRKRLNMHIREVGLEYIPADINVLSKITVKRASLHEISLVSSGAFPGTFFHTDT